MPLLETSCFKPEQYNSVCMKLEYSEVELLPERETDLFPKLVLDVVYLPITIPLEKTSEFIIQSCNV